MSRPRVFIDGREGTTGLQIRDRLDEREDIELWDIAPALRKDPTERKQLLNAADLVFLCLPDEAAREAVGWITSPTVKVIDASTAHRTAAGWDYGFPELSPARRDAIRKSRRVANPGCHATGFISAVAPLTASGMIDRSAVLTCFSLTGYSGGGKKMIAQYRADPRPEELAAPRLYGLDLNHKHLPEMQKVCGLASPPIFVPVVDDYFNGMATSVPLSLPADAVRETLAAHYAGEALVRVAPESECAGGMISANAPAGRDELTLIVSGGADRCVVTALFDNLGKGAAGAAVQNMNLMLGLAETTGLSL